jgi:ferredoxin, 2Fe-2S
MLQVTFVLPGGREIVAEARPGETILDIARHEKIAIEGACGGSMACATCHVIVDPAYFERLAPASPEEEDMLDLAESLSATSRLGCQLELHAGLDGLVVTVPKTSLLE